LNVVLHLLVRAVLLAVGLVFAGLVACLFVLMLVFWACAAAWGKLTGRPVARFSTRIDPRSAFDEMMRRAPPAREGSRTPRADAAAGVPRRIAEEATDVEAREPRP
jgi:hypothetical protein